MHLVETIHAWLLRNILMSNLKEERMLKERTILSGVGLISSLGSELNVFYDKIKGKETAIKQIGSFDTEKYRTKIAAEIDGFDPLEYLPKKGLRYMDRSTKLILSASEKAVQDSAYPLREDNDELGVVVGNTFGSLSSISGFDRDTIMNGPSWISPSAFPNCVKNSPAANVSIKYDATCMNVTVSNGLTSSLDAFGYAQDMLEMGNAKTLLVGGVEEFCEQLVFGFERNKLLSRASNPEELKARDQKGMVLGEGSAMFIVEKEADADKRNAKKYAQLSGYKRTFCDDENRQNVIEGTMLSAVENSGIDIDDVDVILINCNGNKELDDAERLAIDSVFTSRKPLFVPIKETIGECYSASGAFQVAAAIAMIQQEKVKHVLINAFGVLGFNTCLVVSSIEG